MPSTTVPPEAEDTDNLTNSLPGSPNYGAGPQPDAPYCWSDDEHRNYCGSASSLAEHRETRRAYESWRETYQAGFAAWMRRDNEILAARRALERAEMDNPHDCEWCDEPFDYAQEGYRLNGAYICESCGAENICWDCERHRDDCTCHDDDDWSNGRSYVHNYSYRPSPNFLSINNDPDDTLFMGFELEIPTNSGGTFAEMLHDGPGQSEDVLYCKEDGSISGVEIVSHPMTHAYLRNRFDWSMFKAASPFTGMLRETPGEGYGLHVHVSRAGFVDEAHALRWMLLFYRNEEAVARLARRSAASWASFSDKKDCVAKARNKHPRLFEPGLSSSDRERYENYDYIGSGARYTAINATNNDTYEVRVFRSTWKRREFRAALDLVHASAVYTRDMAPEDALSGGLEWAAFRDWLSDKPAYKALVAEIDKHAPESAKPADDFTPHEVALLDPTAPEPEPVSERVITLDGDYIEQCDCLSCRGVRRRRAAQSV